jgi:hypothetical protein
MDQSEALSKISKALGVLAYQTHAENLAGLFSKNKLAENLLIPVFRIALDAPQLRNLNQDTANFPYIDLADDHAKLAIQVTTERGAAKVSETLSNFTSRGFQRRYKRLVFFILTPTSVSFTSKTKNNWKAICGKKLQFDPAADIIDTLRLFSLISNLKNSAIMQIHDVIAHSLFGEEYVNTQSILEDQAKRQLEYEKKTGKYIPEIFIETRETKNLARTFAHPALFFGRTLDSLGRLSISSWNGFLAKSGLPPLPFPDLSAYSSGNSVDAAIAAKNLSMEITTLASTLATYAESARKKPPPFEIKKERAYFYEEAFFKLENEMGWGLGHRLEGILRELAATHARVYILTGRAGQGKTNFVCDFIENFLLKLKVPCAYFSGRHLSAIQGPDLGDTIQKLIYEGKTKTFAQAAALLSKHSSSCGKPFVFVIDGLNEHHSINLFAEQLKQFIEGTIAHPNIRFLLTCRSEFFQQRFGGLTTAPLSEHVFLLEERETRLEKQSYDEMLAGYFKFFKINKELVSRQVLETLSNDRLLLRFFCEAYGARGKPAEYRQSYITAVYREHIFEIYLEQKLGTARAFLQRLTDKPSPTDGKVELVAVLERCLSHMLSEWKFADVPMSIIPSELKSALFVLLEEELILRRDPASNPAIFSPPSDGINFTFDEFRDFLLAQYLLNRVYSTDIPAFTQYTSRSDPKNSQATEGLKRFLFYASRKEENTEFWKFYRNHNWYKDVYDQEVFNIDSKLLRGDDTDTVIEALKFADVRAITFARKLSINWHPIQDRLLNLDLLVAFVTQSDDSRFDELIVKAFTTIQYVNEGTSAKGFCKFVSEYILPKFVPDRDPGEKSLFRFLILLMPVDSGPDLNSESYMLFGRLMEMHPEFAVGLLQESLQYKISRHRAYLWRLLSSPSAPMLLVDSFRDAAVTERSQAETADPILYREVDRFLHRLDREAGGKTQ